MSRIVSVISAFAGFTLGVGAAVGIHAVNAPHAGSEIIGTCIRAMTSTGADSFFVTRRMGEQALARISGTRPSALGQDTSQTLASCAMDRVPNTVTGTWGKASLGDGKITLTGYSGGSKELYFVDQTPEGKSAGPATVTVVPVQEVIVGSPASARIRNPFA